MFVCGNNSKDIIFYKSTLINVWKEELSIKLLYDPSKTLSIGYKSSNDMDKDYSRLIEYLSEQYKNDKNKTFIN